MNIITLITSLACMGLSTVCAVRASESPDYSHILLFCTLAVISGLVGLGLVWKSTPAPGAPKE